MINYAPSRATATATIPLVEDGIAVNATNDGIGKRRLADLIAKAAPDLQFFAYDAADFPTLHATASYTYGSQDVADQDLFCDFADCEVGDRVHVEMLGLFSWSGVATAGGPAYVELFAKEDHGGANTYNAIGASLITLATGFAQFRLSMGGAWEVTVPGDLRIEYGVKVDAGDVGAPGFNGIGWLGPFGMRATLYRKIT